MSGCHWPFLVHAKKVSDWCKTAEAFMDFQICHVLKFGFMESTDKDSEC